MLKSRRAVETLVRTLVDLSFASVQSELSVAASIPTGIHPAMAIMNANVTVPSEGMSGIRLRSEKSACGRMSDAATSVDSASTSTTILIASAQISSRYRIQQAKAD